MDCGFNSESTAVDGVFEGAGEGVAVEGTADVGMDGAASERSSLAGCKLDSPVQNDLMSCCPCIAFAWRRWLRADLFATTGLIT